MATWIENDKFICSENDKHFENIIVTHDLQDCIDESLDKVFEQLPIINYSKYSEESEKSDVFSNKENNTLKSTGKK